MTRTVASRPRICILTETYHPVIGGGERQARSLAGDLVANGFRTVIVTRRSSRGLSSAEADGEVSIRRVSPAGAGGSKRWLMLLPSLFALVKLRHDYDIILSPASRPWAFRRFWPQSSSATLRPKG